ncbi:class I SAM-dependent methyltransferase [Desulfovibrio sp. OttesenSCG-928-G11]|nr:class I SAM-dependent methyltransferase [Desulfovibrio sp. OttesenSCG-928-G11]
MKQTVLLPHSAKMRKPGPEPEDLRLAARELGFFPDDSACAALALYIGLLLKWNRAMNLVGPGEWRTLFDSLVADSFHLARLLPDLPLPDAPQCRDLGAGAGLPGIPLRSLWRDGNYVLIEVREKRALFLQNVLALCALPGVRVYRGRAEDFLEAEGGGDLIVSRAFLPWERVLDLIGPFCKSGLLCLFLSNSPIPASLPKPWTPLTQTAYRAGGKERFFWVLRKR